MNVGSLFSGVGGMDYGLAAAGHRHVFFCEWDAWRREVLAARWPGVPIYEDVREVAKGPRPERLREVGGIGSVTDANGARWDGTVDVDLLCGGFPCQDVSVAGRRRGLAGERSGLFFEFARIIDALRPRWLLVENVPGLFTSNGGRDFGAVLGTLADLGYGVGWRVLDSRFFGVPQRRRRVFIVGACADGDPRAASVRAGEVLAVGSRCSGHPATRGEAGQDVAGTLGGGSGERGWAQDTERMTFLPIAGSLNRRDNVHNGQDDGGSKLVAAPLTKGSASGEGVNAPGRRQEDDVNIVAYALRKDPGGVGQGHNTNFVSFDAEYSNQASLGDDKAVLTRKLRRAIASEATGVRRLTPVECERLQGLPDDWTRLDEKTPDSRRYSALGDAVTATVAEWIGRRLEAA